MPIRTRFAPSPTGELHLGHAYSAKFAHDLARSQPDGQFLLRFEDIDHTRCKRSFETSILSDLQWLGLHWDGEIIHQSTRSAHYEAALDLLRERSFVYPCFCTRKEIQAEWEAAAAAPHHPNTQTYPGTCRHLTPDQRSERIAAGIGHCWRLDAQRASRESHELTFTDLLHGTRAVDAAALDDVVLARKDIGVAYHLAVVIDDAFQQITHVTRGEDLLPSTPIHRVLQHLLGLPTPLYLHHPLVCDETGQRLAKRHDSQTLRSLRERGLSQEQILARLDRLELPTATSGPDRFKSGNRMPPNPDGDHIRISPR